MSPELLALRDALIWENTLAGFSHGVENHIHKGDIPCKECDGSGHFSRNKWGYVFREPLICMGCGGTGTRNGDNNDSSGLYHRTLRWKSLASLLEAV